MFLLFEHAGGPWPGVDTDARQPVQQARLYTQQVLPVMPRLKGLIVFAPRRLLLNELHAQRPLVVLQADIEERIFHNGFPAACNPLSRLDTVEAGEHPDEVVRKAR